MFKLEKGKYSNQKKENIPIRKRKIFLQEKGKNIPIRKRKIEKWKNNKKTKTNV